MSNNRLLALGLFGLLLMGKPAAAQQGVSPQQSVSPSFQTRINDLARALEQNPRLKGLNEEQRRDRVEFVAGNVLFVVLHEMAHILIGEMNLPVLAREEDAADTYAALRMLQIGTDFSHRVLVEAAKGWFYNDLRDQQTGAKPLFYDEHELNQQRAYQIVCYMVGSDPDKFKDLADETKLPPERRESCKDEFAKVRSSWNIVLAPHRRLAEEPEITIDVSYGDGMGRYDVFANSFHVVRLLETVAERAAKDFVWKEPFSFRMETCGHTGASWKDKERQLVICYEIAFDFAELYRAYAMSSPILGAAKPAKPTPAATPAAARRGRAIRPR